MRSFGKYIFRLKKIDSQRLNYSCFRKNRTIEGDDNRRKEGMTIEQTKALGRCRLQRRYAQW